MHCCETDAAIRDAQWRRALWAALALNAGMFVVEIAAGAHAGSVALWADALDFFGDAATYAVSLLVAGMALVWRARAAFAKGALIFVFGLIVLASAAARLINGAPPQAATMGAVAAAALLVNAGVAILLFRFRAGDANMRSVWICTRNDVIGNLAVAAAALGVFGTGAAWPDLVVAAIMASLALLGGAEIMHRALKELGPNGQLAPIPVRHDHPRR